MRKKAVSIFVSSIMVCCALMGCGENDNMQQASADYSEEAYRQTGKESGDITLSIWAGEQDEELIAVLADNFIREHADEANITIEWSLMTEGECRSNLLGDVLNAPDLYTTTDGDLRIIVAGGAALPVINPDEIREENLETAVEALTINDTIYGYPITADNGYFLYYNKDYLTEEDVKRLDRILEVAAENEMTFDMDWSSGWYLYSFFGQTGLSVGLNEDGLTNFCDWNSTDNAIKGVDVAEALLSIGANPGFKSTGDWIEDMRNGTCIACVSGLWDESAVRAILGDAYGASRLPTYTCNGQQVQMACYFGYKMVGVNPYSEHIEWAHEFAKYISSEEGQRIRFEMRGQGPSNKNVGQSDEVQQAAAIQAVLAQSAFSEPQRIGSNFWDPATYLGAVCASGEIGDLSLQELMDDLVAEITASTVQ